MINNDALKVIKDVWHDDDRTEFLLYTFLEFILWLGGKYSVKRYLVCCNSYQGI